MRTLLVFLCGLLVACATGGSNKPTHVTLTVNNLDLAMAQDVDQALKAQSEFKNVQRTSLNAGIAVYELDFLGDPGSIQQVLARVKRPVLRNATVAVLVKVDAADTEAPAAAILYPQQGAQLGQKKIWVVATVPGTDVKEVLINGAVTRPFRGQVYRGQLELSEGPQEVVVTAVDSHGNRTIQKVQVKVDTTPQGLAMLDKAAVGGTGTLEEVWLVQGQPATIFTNGTWRVELLVPHGATQVDVIRVDERGLATVVKRPVER